MMDESVTTPGIPAGKSQAECIHDFRKKIDALTQEAVILNSGIPGQNESAEYHRALALVRTKLQEAKMWAGQALDAIGHPLPPEFADKA